MTRRRSVVALAVWAILGLSRPTSAQRPTPIAIEHVNVVTMTDTLVLFDQTVVIADGVIRSITAASSARLPPDAHRIDGYGGFLIPGLTDAHLHVFDVNDLPLLLTFGVTTGLNMAGNPMILEWRDRIRAGSLLGPTLYTTGPQIKPTPHPLVDIVTALADTAGAARLVGEQVEAGYDLIKVWGSHDRATLAAIIHAADSLGIRVTGHLSNRAGLEGAVSLGQSSVAHLEEFVNKFFRRSLDEERIPTAVDLARRGNLAVVTTLATYDMIVRAAFAETDADFVARPGYALLDPVRQLSWRSPYNGYRSASFTRRREYYADALAFQQQLTGALSDGGVLLLAGTDAGMLPGLIPGLEIHRELELLVAAGLSPFEALAAATRNPGSYLGGDEAFGRVAVGARADLVLLEGNPLADIRATRKVHAVIVRGQLLERAALDSLVADLRERNARTEAFVERALGESISAATAYADSIWAATGHPAFELVPPTLLAVNLAEAERTDEARALLELTARSYPDAYLPEFVLGQLLLATGDSVAAERSFRRVLTLVPMHRAARLRLEIAESGSGNARPQ